MSDLSDVALGKANKALADLDSTKTEFDGNIYRLYAHTYNINI